MSEELKAYAGSIVTLNGNEDWLITDETEQDNIKYFLGLKLDENGDETDTSKIFYQESEGKTQYLTEVENQELASRLTAIFAAQLSERAEKEKEEAA